ncbi:kininogen-1 [Megalops cyprinoides]|uniref:kininogen-1 n=1 Tax=Megalops cyprinoides TaxID=118141 RepID=UPI001864E2FD|nr:kininogen-1 [Megalops cyprinoides]
MLRIWLLVLCAVSLQLWTQGYTQELTEVFCDDKDVEAAVDLALVHHNGILPHGNKLALYQVVKALKVVNESGTLLSLHFFARVSDCPVGGDKAWRDCDYLPHGDKMPMTCTSEVHKSSLEDSPKVISVDCKAKVEPWISADRAPCLGCREEIDIANEDLREPLLYSVAKFNTENSSSHHFILNDIASATRQVVAGFRYDLQFEMVKSNCSKGDFKEVTDDCRPHDTEKEFANCNSTVYIAPWRREEPEAHMNCEPGRLMTSFSRRRPPGWSPLRHFIYAARVTPTPATTSVPNPTAKKESSEESQEITAQTPILPVVDTGVADVPPENPGLSLELPLAEPVSPFRCPSEPWKQFVSTTTPPPPQQEPTAA